MNIKNITKYLLLVLAVCLPVSISGSQVIIFSLILVLIAEIIMTKNLRCLQIHHKWIVLILLITPILSLVNAESMDLALKWYKRYFYVLFIFVIASSFYNSETSSKKTISIYVLFSTAAAVIGVLQPFLGKLFELPFNIKTYYIFSTGFISQSNSFAEIMTYSAIAAIYLLYLTKDKNQKVLLSISVIIMYFAIIFSRAKISIILLSLIILVSIPFVLKKQSAYFFAVLIGILLIMSPYTNRIFWRFDKLHLSKQPRIELWSNTYEIFKEHPIIGCGIGNFEKKLVKRKKLIKNQKILTLTHAHNNIFDVFTTMGIIGGLAFLLFWGVVFKDLVVEIKNSSEQNKVFFIMVFVILLSFHLVGMVNCNYKTSITSFQLYLFLGMFYGKLLKEKKD